MTNRISANGYTARKGASFKKSMYTKEKENKSTGGQSGETRRPVTPRPEKAPGTGKSLPHRWFHNRGKLWSLKFIPNKYCNFLD